MTTIDDSLKVSPAMTYRITAPGAQGVEMADLYDALAAAETAYRADFRASWLAPSDDPVVILTWRLEWHNGCRRRMRLLADDMPTGGSPEGVHVDEVVLPSTVTLNPKYGVRFGDGGLCAVYNPGGFWAVKVRQRDGAWVGFAVPRKDTAGEPFDIVTGPDKDEVWYVAQKWASQSSIRTAWGERFIFAGYGDSTEETAAAELPADGHIARPDCRGHELDGGTYYVGACKECSDALAVEIVERINAAYPDAGLTVVNLVRIDGAWTIDGMVPAEWADAVFGDGDLITIEAGK
jgi:hypothetical protein